MKGIERNRSIYPPREKVSKGHRFEVKLSMAEGKGTNTEIKNIVLMAANLILQL